MASCCFNCSAIVNERLFFRKDCVRARLAAQLSQNLGAREEVASDLRVFQGPSEIRII